MGKSVNPDETARRLDSHCLYRNLFWSAWLKGFSKQGPVSVRQI